MNAQHTKIKIFDGWWWWCSVGESSPFWLTLHPKQQIHTAEIPQSSQRCYPLDVAMAIEKFTNEAEEGMTHTSLLLCICLLKTSKLEPTCKSGTNSSRTGCPVSMRITEFEVTMDFICWKGITSKSGYDSYCISPLSHALPCASSMRM